MEFYRSPAARRWTPTGPNVPDYAGMASLWWRNAYPAIAGQQSVLKALQSLAAAMDQHMERIADNQHTCSPRLNPQRSEAYWLDKPGAPYPKLQNEKPPGRTLPYEESLRAWD